MENERRRFRRSIPALLVPLLYCTGGAAQLQCFLVQELPLVLAQPPVSTGCLWREPMRVVELQREAESGGEAILGDSFVDCCWSRRRGEAE